MTPEAVSLIERARDADNPNAQDRARVRRALASTLGAGVLTSAASATAVVRNVAPAAGGPGMQQAAPTAMQSAAGAAGTSATAGALPAVAAAGAAGVSKLAAWAGIGFLAGATSVGGAKLVVGLVEPTTERARVTVKERSASTDQRSSGAIVSQQARRLPGASPASSAVAPVLRARPVEQPRRPAADFGKQSVSSLAAAPRSSGTQLEAELSLIEQAQGALRDGDPGRALMLLAEHERRFPRGLLLEERLASRTLALCNMGLKAEAEKVAGELTQYSPASALWPSVALACGFAK